MELQKIKKYLLVLTCLFIGWGCLASNPSEVDDEVMKIVRQYENIEGVECQVFVKGEGLDIIKMALNREFGRKFMKGVTSIVVIIYTEASEEVCKSFRSSLDVFTSLLEEFDPGEDFAEGEYVRCFAKPGEDDSMSDFVIAVEGAGEKMFMYMGGSIVVE